MKQNEHGHTMSMVSMSGLVDADELARIEFKNGVTGKVHDFSVWASEAANKDYEPFHVFMNSPIGVAVDLANYRTHDDALSDNMWDGYLRDLVENSSEMKEFLAKNYENESDFAIEIPLANQKMDLQEIIVDAELTAILYKIDEGSLEKSDLVDFGKLVEHDEPFSFKHGEILKGDFDKVLSESITRKDEIPYLKATYESLKMELPNELTKSVAIELMNDKHYFIPIKSDRGSKDFRRVYKFMVNDFEQALKETEYSLREGYEVDYKRLEKLEENDIEQLKEEGVKGLDERTNVDDLGKVVKPKKRKRIEMER